MPEFGRSMLPDLGDYPRDAYLKSMRLKLVILILTGVVIGIHTSYGIFLPRFVDELGVSISSAAYLGALSYGLILVLGPAIQYLICYVAETHQVAITGSLLCAIGLLVSSFLGPYFASLYFTYGILFGIGSALVYISAMEASCHCKGELVPQVYSVQIYASGLGMILFSIGGQLLNEYAGWTWTLRVYAIIFAALIFLCVALPSKHPATVRTLPRRSSDASRQDDSLVMVLNLSICQNHEYVVWCLATSLVMMAYHVPYVHLVYYGIHRNQHTSHSVLLLSLFALFLGLGRAFWVFLIGLFEADEKVFFIFGILVTGAAYACLAYATEYLNIALSVILLAAGQAMVSVLLLPLTLALVPPQWASAAWNYVIILNGFFFTMGPLIMGGLKESFSYTSGMLFFAGSQLVAALLLLFLKGRNEEVPNGNGQLTNTSWLPSRPFKSLNPFPRLAKRTLAHTISKDCTFKGYPQNSFTHSPRQRGGWCDDELGRRSYEDVHKTTLGQLRAAVSDPSLTASQMQSLKDEISEKKGPVKQNSLPDDSTWGSDNVLSSWSNDDRSPPLSPKIYPINTNGAEGSPKSPKSLLPVFTEVGDKSPSITKIPLPPVKKVAEAKNGINEAPDTGTGSGPKDAGSSNSCRMHGSNFKNENLPPANDNSSAGSSSDPDPKTPKKKGKPKGKEEKKNKPDLDICTCDKNATQLAKLVSKLDGVRRK